MLPLLKKIFTDETSFIGYARAGLLGLGGAQIAGILPDDFPKWLGVIALMAGGFLRSSQTAGGKAQKP